MSLTGVDIGGFTGDPTPALMVRWNSLGVYTPMFRNHAMLGTKMREPWCWGKVNEAIIKKDIELRYRLLPYIYSGFYQSQKTGIPLSRTLAINYTDDENVFDVKYQNQFLFGDAIMVAPVESTKFTEDVYLPAGEWYRLNTDEKFRGGRSIIADAPLTDLPVFIKAGAIIPMQNIIQSTNEKGDGTLEINVWYGKEATNFVYYEDDGLTYDYEKGSYYKREISFNPRKRVISFSKVEGSFISKYDKLKLMLHGFSDLKNPKEVGRNFRQYENNRKIIKIDF
jgi:alpha-glucosidase